MKRIELIRILESILLIVTGCIHVLFLNVILDRQAMAMDGYIGAMFFGVSYIAFGVLILLSKKRFILPGFIVNALGLITVIVMFDVSPLKIVDPYLIAIDIISVPTLLYLFISYRRARS